MWCHIQEVGIHYKAIKKIISIMNHFKWVSCHHSMVHPQVEDEVNSLQLLVVAVNTLNKQPGTVDMG
jgi:hypothetical protein